MLLFASVALAWTHRGHVWDDPALPLRVCAEEGLEEVVGDAVDTWNQTGAWFVLDCGEPHVTVRYERENPGPLAQFALLPDDWWTGECGYTSIARGEALVAFSGDIDWSAPVGTAAGTCDGRELQTRVLQRYLGVVLGLDTSAEPGVMEAFGDCGTAELSIDDRVGLAALYAAPRICVEPVGAAPVAPTSGCSTAPGGAWLALLGPLLLRRR